MPSDRERRDSFDRVAPFYAMARPGYPEAVFDDIVALAGLTPGARLLEIGAGGGQATLPFARRGFAIVAVELGAAMADALRNAMVSFPAVEVVTGAFEDVEVGEGCFDLAFAASAIHWVEPVAGDAQIARALREGGHVAILRNAALPSAADDPVGERLDAIYREFAPDLGETRELRARHTSTDDSVDGYLERLGTVRSPLFEAYVTRRYPWSRVYDARTYVERLQTQSNHITLAPESASPLYSAITTAIEEEFGGRIAREYVTLLALARKRTSS